jgi:hypothetical protein
VTIAPVVTPERKPHKQNVSKEALAKAPAQVTEKQSQTCLDEPLSSVMVRQITEQQREHRRGNRIHGDNTGCMAGCDPNVVASSGRSGGIIW